MTETMFVVKIQWRCFWCTYYVSDLPGGRTTYYQYAKKFSSRVRAETAAMNARKYYPKHLVDVEIVNG